MPFRHIVIQGALKNEGICVCFHNENMSSVMRGYVRDVTGVDMVLSMRTNMTMPLPSAGTEPDIEILEQLRYCLCCGSMRLSRS